MNGLFYALITEERLTLLTALLANNAAMSAQSMAVYLPLHQPTIRYHLDVLYNAGLLTITRVGQTPVYEVRHKEHVKMLLEAASAICK